MTDYSPLCKRCLRRLVDCDRFYREDVEQCDDFTENDADFNDPAATTATYVAGEPAIHPTVSTAVPTVMPGEEPVADAEPVPDEGSSNLLEDEEVEKEGFSFNIVQLILGIGIGVALFKGNIDWMFILFLAIVVVIHELGPVIFGKMSLTGKLYFTFYLYRLFEIFWGEDYLFSLTLFTYSVICL